MPISDEDIKAKSIVVSIKNLEYVQAQNAAHKKRDELVSLQGELEEMMAKKQIEALSSVPNPVKPTR